MSDALYKAMEHNGLTVEMIVLYLMRNYTFDLKCEDSLTLYLYLTGVVILTRSRCLKVNFSNIEIKQIAPSRPRPI
jgi:hypothetical protein